MQIVFMPAENITSFIEKPKTLLPWVNEFTTLKKEEVHWQPIHCRGVPCNIHPNKQTRRKKKKKSESKEYTTKTPRIARAFTKDKVYL